MTKAERTHEALRIRNEAMAQAELDFINSVPNKIQGQPEPPEYAIAVKKYQDTRSNIWRIYKDSIK